MKAGALHLLKLSVGTESIDDLRRWQARRQALSGRVFHQTRMMPRRAEELLRGGSIYWVIKGMVQARQRLLAIEPQIDAEGRRSTLLVLEPGDQVVLVNVVGKLDLALLASLADSLDIPQLDVTGMGSERSDGKSDSEEEE